MVSCVDLNEFVTGCLLFTWAIVSIYRAWCYYRNVQVPWKGLAKRTFLSLLLFALGSLSVVFDSLIQRPLWPLIAAFYALSYVAIVSTICLSLRQVTALGKRAEADAAGTATRALVTEERRENKLPIQGGYSLQEEPSPLLFQLLKRASNGLIVISRKSREEWVEKFRVEPDEFLWLSRAQVRKAVDPVKLHVIQGKIIQFMESRGSVVVYFEGIEYLTLYNEFASVVKFLSAVKDEVVINDSLMLIHVPKDIFDRKQEAILFREFETIKEEELIKELRRVLALTGAEELALFGVLPPATKMQGGENACDKSSKGEGRAGKEEAQETQPLRREEKTEEGG